VLVVLFSITCCVSAFLLFWLQPLIAKLLLPLLGGTPAVWNTAMMFFQVMLLGGYLYAHLLARLRLWRQGAVHLAVLLGAAATLPFGSAAGLRPPGGEQPIVWLLAALFSLVGLPFFALAASAPLLQSWFARSSNRHAADPYFLYAASNAGSLVSLLAFPVLLERLLSLPVQGRSWAVGFLALILLVALCFLALQRAKAIRLPALRLDAPAPLTWRQRGLWIALAFVPSSLLLGVTSYVSTDLAAVPLLWVVPLALYLLTFIIAFGGRGADAWAPALQASGLTLVTVLLACTRLLGLPPAAWVTVPGNFIGFFAIALGCHCWLAQRRPNAAHLTEFYLWLSLGGALGGMLNALIAPLIFRSTYEYDLGLVLACALRIVVGRRQARSVLLDAVLPLLLCACLFFAAASLNKFAWLGVLGPWPPRLLIAALCAGALLGFSPRPQRLTFAVVLLLGGGLFVQTILGVEHQERSFFGVHRIRSIGGGGWLALIHGDVLHGAESTDPAHWTETSTYYVAGGPVGQFFARVGPAHRVAVIGLGTGGMVCYRKPGEDWTFFEIDPAVVRIAHDQQYFHYLQQCAADTRFVLGDGRLWLDVEPDNSFDVIVLDAFSSDAIPVHLLTREAMRLYLRKLAPHGRLLLHISNTYLDLAPVIAADADSLGLIGLRQHYRPTAAELARQASESEWVAVARDPADLDFLRDDARWQQIAVPPGLRPWTDDYSNVLSVLR